MCIDVCPVGALTSGSYRYKTRPWEMNHVSTVCTHCADGCKVTLGVRQSNDGSEIVRADNRDKSGINGDFLCAKGRFGFDFVESPDRLTTPLVRNAEGKLEPATWEHALRFAASKLKEIRDSKGGAAIGVIGSNRTTNEENYLLQKFARTVLRTNNIDHERTADYADFARALAGHRGQDREACAILRRRPRFCWLAAIRPKNIRCWRGRLRTNVRLNRARLYVANSETIKLERQAKATLSACRRMATRIWLRYLIVRQDRHSAKRCMAEESLVVIFGEEYRGQAVADLVEWGLKRGNVQLRLSGRPRQLARRGGHGPLP